MSSKVSLEELNARAEDADRMVQETIGCYFRHRKTGHAYVLVGIALRESDLEPLVIYRRYERPMVTFARPLAEMIDGRFRRAPELPT